MDRRYIHLFEPRSILKFWRDPVGPEVDWVVESSEKLIPIEVKWTNPPTKQDSKNLTIFMEEYPINTSPNENNGACDCITLESDC